MRRALEGSNPERGAAMLEMAIVAPLMLLILFGIIQYGQILSAHIALRNAASVAAREGTLSGATASSIANAAREALVDPLDAADLPDGQINIENPLINGNTATRVTLTYYLPLMISYVVPGASGGSMTLTASATMR